MKLTKELKEKIEVSLLNRYLVILEQDTTTDGFHDDVADALGANVDDLDSLTLLHAQNFNKALGQWLARCPRTKR